MLFTSLKDESEHKVLLYDEIVFGRKAVYF